MRLLRGLLLRRERRRTAAPATTTAASARRRSGELLGGPAHQLDGADAVRHQVSEDWGGDVPRRDRIGTGLLSTAGRLLFANDAGGNLVARDVANGKPLWHAHIGNGSNAPQTYMVDGRQYVLAAVGDMLYAFALYR